MTFENRNSNNVTNKNRKHVINCEKREIKTDKQINMISILFRLIHPRINYNKN